MLYPLIFSLFYILSLTFKTQYFVIQIYYKPILCLQLQTFHKIIKRIIYFFIIIFHSSLNIGFDIRKGNFKSTILK